MKKLFKHLAIVLALALVIGLVPARTAEAADYSLKFKNKYLYVGAKGETAHGVDTAGNPAAKPIKRSLKFGGGVIDGLKDGDVVTFKSADRTVAKGSRKYQRVFAVGVGETDVAVKVNGEEIGSMHFIVKQNAKSLAVDVPETVGIGDIDVKVNVEPANATDIFSIVIPEEYKDIAEVTGKAVDGVENGVATIAIKTKKPGTFKIQALAQQNNSTLTGFHVKSEEVEVQAAVKVISAVQKSANEITFTFDTDMTDIADAKQFKVYYKPMTGADVTTAVEKYTIASEDGKTLVLKLWNDFLEDTEYFVEYSGQVSSFTTAKLDIAHAAQIRVNELEITKTKVTPYDYDVLDANGVEMPESLKTYVTFKGDSTDKIQVGSDFILFDEAGLQANVTATFDAWYEVEGTAKQNTFKNVFLFKSVDETPVTVSATYWTIGRDTITGDDPDDFAEPNHLIAVDDEKIGVSSLSLLIEFSDGSAFNVSTNTAYTRNIKDAFSKKYVDGIVLSIADPGVAEIAGNVIKPVKVGTTQVLVKVKGQDKPFYVIPLDVKAKAVPQTMTISAENDYTKLNTDLVSDYVEFEILVKDQYGREFKGATITAEKASATDTAVVTKGAIEYDGDNVVANKSADTDEEGLAYVKFTPAAVGGNGVAVIKFTATKDSTSITNSTKSISVKAAGLAPATDVSTYVLSVEKTKLNQKVGSAIKKPADLAYETTVKVYPIDSNGYKIGDKVDAILFKEDTIATASNAGYAFKVYANAKELEDEGNAGYVLDGKFRSVAKDGGYVTKLPAKSAQIKLYRVTMVKGKIETQACVDTKVVTITDTTLDLSVEKIHDQVTGEGTIKNAFNVYYVADDPITVTKWNAKVGTNSIWVESAEYEEVIANNDAFLNGQKLKITGNVGYTLVVGDTVK